jgi:hypothetical protein
MTGASSVTSTQRVQSTASPVLAVGEGDAVGEGEGEREGEGVTVGEPSACTQIWSAPEAEPGT